MKLKPFDLKAAIAGKPVVTRGGQSFIFGGFNASADAGYQLIGWINGYVSGWHESGKFDMSESGSFEDLFMAPEKIVRWVNIYKEPEFTEGAHTTRQIADDSVSGNRISCVRIEFEEGEGL